MPFKTYEELMETTKNDPKMAMMFVNRSKSTGKPTVDNPGNSNDASKKQETNPRMSAVQRRLKKVTPSPPEDTTQEMISKRKSEGY